MEWGQVMLVAYAARLSRLLGIAGPARGHSLPHQNNGISGPAVTAGTPQNSGGAGQLNLKARALRLHNRNARAASIYERKHIILMEGRNGRP